MQKEIRPFWISLNIFLIDSFSEINLQIKKRKEKKRINYVISKSGNPTEKKLKQSNLTLIQVCSKIV